ncbi:Transmembrane protein [Zancudomyces culisetae]|uniref:Transmembrane protein n=1 Tax=Zancudomyces culisetae TaxID=1213189 RepID=A0A1R1PCF1_ZANCU|nr:Transmembrane protein [Zancudomyces culisetae]|eukprot:OMH78633.1 Transmembrane protein [Zancudomyces culisetae]
MAAYLQNALICIEMFVAAIGHYTYFSHVEYRPKNKKISARARLYHAIRDAFGLKDVLFDAREAWSGKTYTYSHFDPKIQVSQLDNLVPVQVNIDDTRCTASGHRGLLGTGKNRPLLKKISVFNRNKGNEDPSKKPLLPAFKEPDSRLAHAPESIAAAGTTAASSEYDIDSANSEMNDNKLDTPQHYLSTDTREQDRHYVRQKRVKAGMRYTAGGKQTYWVEDPGRETSSEGISRQTAATNHSKTGVSNHAPFASRNTEFGDRQVRGGLDRGKSVEANEGAESDEAASFSSAVVFKKGDTGLDIDSELDLDFESEAFGADGAFRGDIEKLYMESRKFGNDPNYPVIALDSRLGYTAIPSFHS